MAWHYVWTNAVDPLTSQQKEDNAWECWDLLVNSYGWTEEAAAAVISNFQHEGYLNLGQWQIGSTIGDWENDEVGLGMGQWTPPKKLGDYCGGWTEAAVCDGQKQINCVIDPVNAGQWVQRVNSQGYASYYQTSGIPYITSIVQFSQSNLAPEDLATCWCACWEGPSKRGFRLSYTIRRTDARYWYDKFSGTPSTGKAISFVINGNGTASASVYRATQGQQVTITATPNAGDTFQGWSLLYGDITLNPNDNPQTFTMGTQAVQIQASFTGTTPPPPPPPFENRPPKKMPIWMYPIFRG